MRRRIGSGCAGIALALFGWIASRGAVPEGVDLRPALVIGPLVVSEYRVERAFRRFSEGWARREGRPATPAEIDAWFGRFLAEQKITAEALREGYGGRPEVTREVARMERNMLTQAQGPYYQWLYEADGAPRGGGVPADAIRREIGRRRQVAAAHRAAVLREEGFEFNPQVAPEIVARVRRLGGRRLDPSALSEFGGAWLAAFSEGGRRRLVGVGDFCAYYNDLYVRIGIADPRILRRQLEDLVIARRDYADAVRDGLADAPRFREDRENYLDAQALAAFERDRMPAGIRASDAAVSRWYRDHLALYTPPAVARPVALSEAAPAIRARLEEPRRWAWEAKLAASLFALGEIRDRIDYAAYDPLRRPGSVDGQAQN